MKRLSHFQKSDDPALRLKRITPPLFDLFHRLFVS